MPESLSSACSQERRTALLVRNSSFIASTIRSAFIGLRAVRPLDRSRRHSMLIRVRARQADREADRQVPRTRWENRVTLAVGVDRVHAGRKPSLDPLSRLLKSDLERVNRLIVQRMHSPVTLIPQLAGHIVAGGGKRLRPMLTLGSARLCGYRGDRHVALAAAVEFIHTATL